MKMGRFYKRLNYVDRFKRDMRIIELKKEGKKNDEICDIIFCNGSTVTRAIAKYGKEYGLIEKVEKPVKVVEEPVFSKQEEFKQKGESMIAALVKEDFASFYSRGKRARAYAPVYMRRVSYVPPIAQDLPSKNDWRDVNV